MNHSSLRSLLGELAVLGALPVAAASAMPPGMYTSNELVSLERDRLFRREWICAGRAAEIPVAGDYLTFDLDSQPIVIIRQKDGSISAMSNVCRHRMMTLAEGTGRCSRLVCPYHAWTYALDGRLIAAPYMDSREDFDKSVMSLAVIRCELWQGWIYVTLNPDVEPVADLLAGLLPLVDRYRMADYISIGGSDQIWDTNWKQLTENFMEGYHLPVAHRGTVGGYFPVDKTRFAESDGDPAFTYQYFAKTEDAPVGVAHPDNTTLEGDERLTSILPTVFPSHMFSLAPDHLWYLSLQPLGTGQVRVRHGAALAPEVLAASDDPDKLIAETRVFLERVNAEDRYVVEGIHRGARAPLSSGGPLCWLERENHEFTRYLARMLCGGDSGD